MSKEQAQRVADWLGDWLGELGHGLNVRVLPVERPDSYAVDVESINYSLLIKDASLHWKGAVVD